MRIVTLEDSPIGDWEKVNFDDLKRMRKTRAKKKDPTFTDYYDLLIFDSINASKELVDKVFAAAKVRAVIVPKEDKTNELYGFVKTPENSWLNDRETLEKYLFFGQDGRMMPFNETIRIDRPANNKDVDFKVTHFSRWHTHFEGKFPKDIEDGTIAHFSSFFDENYSSPIGYTASMPLDTTGGSHDIFIYEQHSKNVQWRLKFDYYDSADNLVQTIYLDKKINHLEVDERAEKLFIEIQAVGEGTLDLRWLAQRRSRNGFGMFLPGDKVIYTPGGEEILTYFQPGHRMDKLIISFTGFLGRLPKFEMMSMMGEHDIPSLFIQDSRTDGGAFHMGAHYDPEYEKMLLAEMRRYMDLLGIESKDVIINGYSMGTLGATYYGRRLEAGQVIISKPLTDLDRYTSINKNLIIEPNPMVAGWQNNARELIAGDLKNTPWGYREKLFGEGTFKNSKVAIMHMNWDDAEGSGFEFLKETVKKESGNEPYVESYDGPHASHMGEMYEIINSTIEAFIK